MQQRVDGRLFDQLRNLKVTFDPFGYAASSILFELGSTKVLCSVSMTGGVPPFLKGSNTGWLTAEYAMLPTATTVRTQRESSTMKKNGRGVEISRLISRSLRAVVDLTKIGEKTITIDCDVLQADGGTRTACITAAYYALERAVAYWVAQKEIKESIIKDSIASISAGIYKGSVILDPNFEEDSAIDADFNFVMTKTGSIIEIQGTAEKAPVSWEHFEHLKNLALKGTQDLFTYFDGLDLVKVVPAIATTHKQAEKTTKNKGMSLFSLANRGKQS